jgi:hypothetical protein
LEDIKPLENSNHRAEVSPAALAKDVNVKLPPGQVGNPTAIPQCTDTQFFKVTAKGAAKVCRRDSGVGVVSETMNEPSAGASADTVILKLVVDAVLEGSWAF